ncbi:hypothetical protein E2C01_033576 [Portunus trituberculatus]|uniref:Uncharacterized protein n=1 Tax=Portunus trituberculatus TaxID=210409 RepID=A0A5B7EZ09_PORTR|nr:hypothetical protein [Portunus trituberculatus]
MGISNQLCPPCVIIFTKSFPLLGYFSSQFPTSPRSPSSLYLRHSRSSDMVMANTDTISAANFFRLTSLIFSWIS